MNMRTKLTEKLTHRLGVRFLHKTFLEGGKADFPKPGSTVLWSARSSLGLFPNRVQLVLRKHIKHAIRDDGRAVERVTHVDGADHFQVLAVREDRQFAVFTTKVDFAVHPVGGAP